MSGTFPQTIDGWLSLLVAIPSVNPRFAQDDPSVSGEVRMVDALEPLLKGFGAKFVVRHEVGEDPLTGKPRENLYALFEGQSPEVRVWDIHLDTVGVGGMTIAPFSGSVQADRVIGRGSVDTKASLALALFLLQRAQHRGQRPAHTLLLALTADEELGGLGAAQMGQWMTGRGITPASIVVAEPTNSVPVIAHNGAVRVLVKVSGRRAHTATPHLGVNAVLNAAEITCALREEHKRLQDVQFRTFTGTPQLTVTRISGGESGNSVPDYAELNFDRRLVPGESAELAFVELSALVGRWPGVTAEITSSYRPVYTRSDAPIVTEFKRLTGKDPTSVPFGTNAAHYGAELAETDLVVFGPGDIAQAHTPDEFVTLDALQKAFVVVERWFGFN